ncbi:MAG: PTS sugar transporter subunit IIC [Myxococcales bacterium]|nr:PTS sugar transporter subunit IIC [Myxococcales bacterium]
MDPVALGLDLAVIALIGGGLSLDRRGAFQLMLSQPVVAVPLLALCLGAPGAGLQLGAVLQLLWMASSLFGANVPQNETVASLAIGGMVFLTQRHTEPPAPLALEGMAILLGAPLSLVGRWAEVQTDRANMLLARRADTLVRGDHPERIGRLPWLGLVRAFIVGAGLVAGGALVGFALLGLLHHALNGLTLGTAITAVEVYVIPAVGLGVALSHLRRRRALALATVSFVLALLLLRPGGSP